MWWRGERDSSNNRQMAFSILHERMECLLRTIFFCPHRDLIESSLARSSIRVKLFRSLSGIKVEFGRDVIEQRGNLRCIPSLVGVSGNAHTKTSQEMCTV